MTITMAFRSLLPQRLTAAAEVSSGAARLCAWRAGLGSVEIAVPAALLRDLDVVNWCQTNRSAVNVQDTGELSVAVAAGIDPACMIVHNDGLDTADVGCEAALGVGRVIVRSPAQVDDLARQPGLRSQGVLVGVEPERAGGGSRELDATVEAILVQPNTVLIGVFGDVGPHDDLDGQIAELIAAMERVRRSGGPLLTTLWLQIQPTRWGDVTRDQVRRIAGDVDGSIEDACARLRFPRPTVGVVLPVG